MIKEINMLVVATEMADNSMVQVIAQQWHENSGTFENITFVTTLDDAPAVGDFVNVDIYKSETP